MVLRATVGGQAADPAGLDEKVLGLHAGGMSVRDIAAHRQELYGVQVGRDTISRVTDAVFEDIAAWRTRPLEVIYPIVYLDAIMVKVPEDRSVKTRACYLVVGGNLDGDRELLGLWWQETEGAKFWLAVLNDLHHRGVADVPICCVDLRQVCSAANVEEAECQLELFDKQRGATYPLVAQTWRARWEYVFLSLPAGSTSGRLYAKGDRRPQPPSPQSDQDPRALPRRTRRPKLIYLAMISAEVKWKRVMHWTAALRALIHFGDRIPRLNNHQH